MRKIAEEGEPPELVGPELPRDTVISFWQERKPHLYDRSIQNESRYRSEVLFGTRRARDGFHFDKYTSDLANKPDTREPFKLLPSAFLRRAEKTRPEAPQATASGFSQWLYSLYATAYGDDEDRERGKALEQAIYKHRLNAQGAVHNGYLRSVGSEWRLIHNGLHLPGHGYTNWFTIDHLRVNGEALRVSPDLIYHHPRFNEIMIVEIKNSWMRIPSNLWPNVWGQLWCYSQLDIARNAGRVTVIGEVWGERTKYLGRGTNRDPVNVLHMRASERRDPRAPAFDRFFRALFDIYCGGR
ncbi:hypothetical protein [Paraburkholderia sp. MM5477-R1]|uniref:hypothetical protein n=1 Tax=Paraburkholderia sp. MM5477-R1 TaxID=2991062 RepID=UPI003D1EEC3C